MLERRKIDGEGLGNAVEVMDDEIYLSSNEEIFLASPAFLLGNTIEETCTINHLGTLDD